MGFRNVIHSAPRLRHDVGEHATKGAKKHKIDEMKITCCRSIIEAGLTLVHFILLHSLSKEDADEGDDDDDAASRRIPLGKECNNTGKLQQMEGGEDMYGIVGIVWEEEERSSTLQDVCCVL